MKVLFLVVIFIFYSLNSSASELSYMLNIENILTEVVDQKRESFGLVGLSALVVQNGSVIGIAASGERKKDSGSFISPNDKWHIGSITKSFTATMIARLIEQGDLEWDTSIDDLFPDRNEIHSAWRHVTLRHLLTHTSGAKSNFSLFVNLKRPDAGVDIMRARESAVMNILSRPPEKAPGSAFMYSNVGYTIAGVMAEKKTGIAWESLIMREVFAPLMIKSGGFGAPQDAKGRVSQPWGHKNIFGFIMGSKSDNTPIIGPAGSIHMSLNDLALYATEHLKGIKGRGSILTEGSFKHLHAPNLNNYAYGWVIGSPKDLGVGNVHWHNGSNSMWYSLLAILPEINSAIAVTSNDGKFQAAEQASWEIIKRLTKPLTIAYKKSINSDAVSSASY